MTHGAPTLAFVTLLTLACARPVAGSPIARLGPWRAEAPRRASAVAPSQQAARTETLERRIAGVVALHDDLADGYARFLRSEQGGLLVRRFRQTYSGDALTDAKMLDLVLWKTKRPARR